jgi:hypothetical protein
LHVTSEILATKKRSTHAFVFPDNHSRYHGFYTPISELQAYAADIELLLLSANDISYKEAVDDQLFAAHQPYTEKLINPFNNTFKKQVYLRDEPARALGCASRDQYCRGTGKAGASCTPLAGRYLAQRLTIGLWHTESEMALFNWVAWLWIHPYSGVLRVPGDLGESALKARFSKFNGVQDPLPANQWQKEVEYWFMTSLAMLQRRALERVMGPLGPETNKTFFQLTAPKERSFCRNQVR